ncbi:DUF3370 domain-containing protein [Crocosphaera sp. XPORK-15E]|uniref:DUF3370 domain-containing protein n=1 Tax=Crocosphaera sp. XPORK-15E TaxID=3110247 RepID=UPI002B1F267D|nr:DUF3370 domain-containing protein [Crocosphaera sp. XPORK-15E]MEA5534393.1 DUF3370 domain-containing protein [Crocosphaera sp. XPORK-15E]
MLSLLSSLLIGQTASYPLTYRETQPHFVTQPQEIRPLPGKLNDVLVFNSNSPEVVSTEGVLLSTFPPNGKRYPNAHLNYPIQGRFDVFTHHISRPSQPRKLYQGLLVHNPTSETVVVRVLQGASYVNSTDAPFINLPSIVEDPSGRVFSGPGSRLMGDILRGVNQQELSRRIVIPPYQTRMLFSLPINPSNARSTFLRVYSDGPLYMANLAQYEVAQTSEETTVYREPNLNEWRHLVTKGNLIYPRDLVPTPPNVYLADKTIYGRVAGISVGSEWQARLVDQPGKPYLSIPQRGSAFSYPLSTVTTGTHGTQQIQSAPMLVRYADTAYQAHGNYGVHYNLTLPLVNKTNERQTVAVTLQTPFKENQYADRLIFTHRPQGQVFFRGTVQVSYQDETGNSQQKFFHLVQRQGQQGDPLVRINLAPGEKRDVAVDFLYPPDATPPQVLTVKTLELFYGSGR